ncbi:FAD-dependent oxidoreductase [Breznakiella homolactica]|uniref:FAD-dependent oxidoreductase n=1 Tax=Breznakiella homolactica TaxID=2798577 RepID=A0A7T8BC33_9SPIR|nr:FAD-dependent oxidoreductase [Breznakiella homolactica]QQO11177.1 FAD-dependent oxidoreductase [Breznakiella homolactica]
MQNKLKFEVAVIGGGPAGTVAAIAAARGGAKTILIERFGCLGGMLTMAGTGPQMTFHAGNKQVIFGIPNEIVERLKAQGFSIGHMKDAVGYCGSTTAFDPEGMKITLETMAREANVTILYHTTYTGCTVKDGKIVSAQLYSKGGFMELEADVFIDASADADLATHAGVGSVFGRESDNLAQPMTMNARVYNVDREKMLEFIEANPDEVYKNTPKDLRSYPRYGIQGAYSIVKQAKENGDFNVDRDLVLCFETNNKGEYIINMTRVIKRSAVDPFDLTEAEIDGRKQVHETVRFLRKYIPGFENCILMTSGPQIGIRESRKINGVYKLTGDDLVKNTMFEDAVAMGGYPIDIHSPDGQSMNHRFLKDNTWYSIPYRCLITNEIDNLIVTGRCLSATHEACAAVRVTPIIMAISEGAGAAAAQAVKDKASVKEIDVQKLRKTLKDNGVFLEEYRE